MKRLGPVLISFAVTAPLVLLLYGTWWAVQYRLPPSAGTTVDLRADKTENRRYITFCAALASNPHGFPGHAYVVWSADGDVRSSSAEPVGFVPRYSRDQIPSLYSDVPGLLVHGAAAENSVNLDTFTVIVGADEYERTKKLRDEWDPSVFHTGVRDCVAFVDCIAESIGLAMPSGKFSFPQDHLKQLKRLNARTLQLSNACKKSAHNPCAMIARTADNGSLPTLTER